MEHAITSGEACGGLNRAFANDIVELIPAMQRSSSHGVLHIHCQCAGLHECKAARTHTWVAAEACLHLTSPRRSASCTRKPVNNVAMTITLFASSLSACNAPPQWHSSARLVRSKLPEPLRLHHGDSYHSQAARSVSKPRTPCGLEHVHSLRLCAQLSM